MHEDIRPNSLIKLENLLNLLLAASPRANKESIEEIKETTEPDSETEKNMTFTGITKSFDNSFLDRDDTNSKDNYMDDNKDN